MAKREKLPHAGRTVIIEQDKDGSWHYRIEGTSVSGPQIPCNKQRVIELAKMMAKSLGKMTDGETS